MEPQISQITQITYFFNPDNLCSSVSKRKTTMMKSIREYHEATKHNWEKLYQDSHTLDWSNQPNPFRTYLECSRIDLGSGFEKMHDPLSNVWSFHDIKPRNELITVNTLSTLLYYSMAISAWKSYPGVEPWSLRVNPSSGDLHPTETHVYVHKVKALSPGAYHYLVKDHQLELRAIGDIVPNLWQALGGTSITPPIIIGLNSIFWREAWKYQSRALRYCYLDLGHAMASIRAAAHGLGLFVLFIGGFHDENIRQYLCLDKTDEHPLLFLAIDTNQPVVGTDSRELRKGTINASLHINRLSRKEVDYPLITQAHALTTEKFKSPLHKEGNGKPPVSPFNKGGTCVSNFKIHEGMSIHEHSLKWTIRHRRSAIDFDGQTKMSLDVFRYLMQFLWCSYKADYVISKNSPLIIPYLYIHRVEGLERGLYCLDRTNKQLFLLSRGDMQHAAKELSLNQDIASDSAFAISFVSNFDYALNTYGNRGYRYIHYEAGFLGQSLYSGATAAGFDATGIGAFIDDEVHTFLKTPAEQQSVYHFTIGKRIDDPRLSTLPAYDYDTIHDNEEDMK